jgi:ubiquitin conjugation factor E4 B
MQQAIGILEKVRHLLISYTGFTLQDPNMFPQPAGYVNLLRPIFHF